MTMKQKQKVYDNKPVIVFQDNISNVPVADRLVCPICDRIFDGRLIGPSSVPAAYYAYCDLCNYEFCRLCYMDFHCSCSCRAAWVACKAMLSHNKDSYRFLSYAAKERLESKKRRVDEVREENAKRVKQAEDEDEQAIAVILTDMERAGMDKNEIERRGYQLKLVNQIRMIEREMNGETQREHSKAMNMVGEVFKEYERKMREMAERLETRPPIIRVYRRVSSKIDLKRQLCLQQITFHDYMLGCYALTKYWDYNDYIYMLDQMLENGMVSMEEYTENLKILIEITDQQNNDGDEEVTSVLIT